MALQFFVFVTSGILGICSVFLHSGGEHIVFYGVLWVWAGGGGGWGGVGGGGGVPPVNFRSRWKDFGLGRGIVAPLAGKLVGNGSCAWAGTVVGGWGG